MKTVKLKLFGLLSLLTILNLSAQEIITSDMFSQPANTGANMTVGVNASALDLFEAEVKSVLFMIQMETDH